MPRKRTIENGELSTADAFISQKNIGQRIKRLRLKKSMGLVELGKHTGLSASFLSQLETGRVVPTLRNLARIAMVFSKDLSYFFDTEPRALFRVHRTNDRIRLPENGATDPSYLFESLGYQVPDRQLDPYLAEFLPGKRPAEMRTHSHPGFEFVFLLEGELDIHHGETIERLTARDAVYFDATTPHLYVCTSNTPAKAIVITVNPPAQASVGISKHFGAPPPELRKPDGATRPGSPRPPYNGLTVAMRPPLR